MTDGFTVVGNVAAAALETVHHIGFQRKREFVLKWKEIRDTHTWLQNNFARYLWKLTFT